MKTTALSQLVTRTLLIVSLTTSLTACRPKLVVIDGEKKVTRLPVGQTFTPPQNGYFVPDARMKEILDRLAETEANQPKQ